MRERILLRCPLAEWQGAVHEVIRPFGRLGRLDAPIEHRKLHPAEPGRNLRIYEKLIEKGAILSEREQFYYARELSDNRRFEEAEPIFYRLLSIMPASSPDRGQLCRNLAACRDAAKDPDGALRYLLFALENGCPSSVTCCELGRRYLNKGLYAAAAEWYLRAMTDGSKVAETFDRLDCPDFIPCIQLCLCFDKQQICRSGAVEPPCVLIARRTGQFCTTRPILPKVRLNKKTRLGKKRISEPLVSLLIAAVFKACPELRRPLRTCEPFVLRFPHL